MLTVLRSYCDQITLTDRCRPAGLRRSNLVQRRAGAFLLWLLHLISQLHSLIARLPPAPHEPSEPKPRCRAHLSGHLPRHLSGHVREA